MDTTKAPYSEPPPPYSEPPYPPGNPNQMGQGVPYPPQPNQPGYQSGYPMGPSVVIGAPPASGQGQAMAAVVVNMQGFGPYPMQIQCSHCNAQVMTETAASPGLLTWLLSGTLCVVQCWMGCCLIPFCIPECQDIEHRCPNCKTHLGTYRRL